MGRAVTMLYGLGVGLLYLGLFLCRRRPQMRLLVCGGRDYKDRAFVFDVLDAVTLDYPVNTLVVGGAPGADTLAADWGRMRGVPCEIYPAKWDLHGKAAGHIRNREMLQSGVDTVVFFPGGRGTANMVQIARAKGVRVIDATSYENKATS